MPAAWEQQQSQRDTGNDETANRHVLLHHEPEKYSRERRHGDVAGSE
jgi:hypothetical protein